MTIEDTDHCVVDRQLFYPFVQSCVHIIRNMLDHGIEDPLTRITYSKDEHGKIAITLSATATHWTIVFSDDGAGIDTQKIRQRIIDLKLLTKKAALALSESDVLRYILHDGFSTKTAVSTVSGRGVGLNAVYMEVLNLQGTLHIETVLHEGTQFIITIPKTT